MAACFTTTGRCRHAAPAAMASGKGSPFPEPQPIRAALTWLISVVSPPLAARLCATILAGRHEPAVRRVLVRQAAARGVPERTPVPFRPSCRADARYLRARAHHRRRGELTRGVGTPKIMHFHRGALDWGHDPIAASAQQGKWQSSRAVERRSVAMGRRERHGDEYAARQWRAADVGASTGREPPSQASSGPARCAWTSAAPRASTWRSTPAITARPGSWSSPHGPPLRTGVEPNQARGGDVISGLYWEAIRRLHLRAFRGLD